MKRSLPLTVLASGLFSLPVLAEPHPGQELHDSANCMKCHASQPYDPVKTPTYEKLVKAVAFCNNNLNTGMFEDEVEQLADYLNQEYYKHPKP
ncbi:hypothetical protein [Thiomicrorhabdus sp. 6S3-12]|uniref:hypothetical protein n=1 Tax=Thiomicrorhabdus sp. 6S3-12 TaxID=2819681 RepID=UPI001AACA2A4|nr:hypothetical protein [Thiomicrorhabdus sp. 6S3-12]MBO1925007.1 hypothetical protein [Thiomicrorhabdus sp. 6S3-12]